MLDRWRGWTPSPTAVRRVFLGALVANVAIVVTGGAVRLTASGLGCPTFPRCTDDSLVATREMGAARRDRVRQPDAHLRAVGGRGRRRGRRLAGRAAATCGPPPCVLLGGIVAQALLGGVTVLTGLNPVTVMAHFLLSMALIAVAMRRVRAVDRAAGPAPAAGPPRGRCSAAAACWWSPPCCSSPGTVVTGTGPHSGDKDATDRLPFDLGRGHPAARRPGVPARRAGARARRRAARHRRAAGAAPALGGADGRRPRAGAGRLRAVRHRPAGRRWSPRTSSAPAWCGWPRSGWCSR